VPVSYVRRVPRPPRLQIAGAAYHVSSRAVAQRPLFRDDGDRRRFLVLLGMVVTRHEWVCGAYCLMTTHYHLVVRTPKPDLALGMQSLNSCYAQEFNRRHGVEGHVFFRRYHSVLIEREAHVLELCRYVAMNPVRAGLCTRPEDWPWGSYRAALAHAPTPTFLSTHWLLEFFGRDPDAARHRLRAFVEDAPGSA
jgi:putative transposase